MHIETERLVIRPFERKDAENLFHIAREEEIVRFMPDWAEGRKAPRDYEGYIDWQQAQKDSTDVYENKRYAVALRDSDEMIGMVGMGLEEVLHEVEVAYFLAQRHRRQGYAKEAVDALVAWCFAASELPYLILAIDVANEASCRLGESCGFELFERRTPLGHRQTNMEGDYYYYRKYRD